MSIGEEQFLNQLFFTFATFGRRQILHTSCPKRSTSSLDLVNPNETKPNYFDNMLKVVFVIVSDDLLWAQQHFSNTTHQVSHAA